MPPTLTAPTPVPVSTRPSVGAVDVIVSAPEALPVPRASLPQTIRRLANVVTVLLLLAALTIPLFGFLFRPLPVLHENRSRHPFPLVALKRHGLQDFPQWFSLYFKDRMGYRDVFLGWHKSVTYRWLDIPVTNQAWIGKDGWLFLNVADPFPDRSPEDPRFKDTINGPVSLRVERWCQAFADRRAYLAARGIEYVVVLAPEKSSVYPEHLTGHPRRHPAPEPLTHAEQQLREAGVPCVNLLPVLRSARDSSTDPLYFATDSHWTPTGARLGYEALSKTLTKMFPEFTPHPESDYLRQRHRHSGDLLKLTGDTDREPEICRIFTPPAGQVSVDESPAFLARLPESMKVPHLKPATFTNPAATGPEVLVLRDSFCDAMLPFFGMDFPRATVLGTHRFPVDIIESEKPKLVIQEIVGRFLYSTAPDSTPLVTGFRLRN